MPNRKFKVPEVGQLVLAKETKFRLSRGKRETYFSRKAKVGEALMYLGVESYSEQPSSFTPRYVYKFLADGIILYTYPTEHKPKQWLSKNVRLMKVKKRNAKQNASNKTGRRQTTESP